MAKCPTCGSTATRGTTHPGGSICIVCGHPLPVSEASGDSDCVDGHVTTDLSSQRLNRVLVPESDFGPLLSNAAKLEETLLKTLEGYAGTEESLRDGGVESETRLADIESKMDAILAANASTKAAWVNYSEVFGRAHSPAFDEFGRLASRIWSLMDLQDRQFERIKGLIAQTRALHRH